MNPQLGVIGGVGPDIYPPVIGVALGISPSSSVGPDIGVAGPGVTPEFGYPPILGPVTGVP